MAEYPDTVVCKLPDAFSDTELIHALERLMSGHVECQRLSASGLQVVVERHSPKIIASQYKEVVEGFYFAPENSALTGYWALINSVADLPGINNDEDVVEVSVAIAANEMNI